MKSKTQKYFETMQNRLFYANFMPFEVTNISDLHTMSLDEESFNYTTFDERVYLENEAFSQFCDFLNEE